MRVGLIHYLLNVKGGGERVCLYLSEHLLSKGHQVAIATGIQPGPKAFEFFQNFKSYYFGHGIRIPFGLYRNMMNYTDAVLYLIKGFRPDVVLFTQASSIIHLQLLNMMRIPAILYCHWPGHIAVSQRGRYVALGNEYKSDENGEPFFHFRRFPLWRVLYYAPYKLLMNWSEDALTSVTIVANSHFTKRAIRKLWGVEPYCVVYPPVDISYFSPRFELKRDDMILMVARYSHGKGHLEALRIMRALKEQRRNVKLVMVGSLTPRYYEYFQKVKETIDRYGLKRDIELRVDIGEEELLGLFREATVLLHPIRTEHFGISIVEAMGCGTPVIGGRGGGLVEIVEDGKTGFLFHDFKEAKKQISMLLDDPNLRRRMGHDAFERSKLFDKEVFKRRMEEIIMESALRKK